ncbi:MAG: tetratricopeptide repeat protein [Armatimonadetes bacterium]|nr:tetratricopeptide repeat protein [Armatimonadota bacterium]
MRPFSPGSACRPARTLLLLVGALVLPAAGALPAASYQQAAPPAAPEGTARPEATKERPKSRESAKDLFERGREAFEAKRYEDALNLFLRAGEKDKKNAALQAWTGLAYYNLGRNQEAIRYFQVAVKEKPKEGRYYNNLGNAYLADRAYEDAIKTYNQAIPLFKGKDDLLRDAYYNLGSAYLGRGDLDEALTALTRAAEYSKDDPRIQNNLGFVYEQKYQKAKEGERDPALLARAVEHYQKAVDKDKENAVYQGNLALAQRRQGGSSASLQQLERAARLNPGNYGQQIALAETYQQLGQVDDAIQAYRAAIAARDGDYVPHYNLGLLLVQKGQYPEALAALRRANDLNKTDERILAAIGWVHLKQANYAEAATWYRRSLDARPDFQMAHASLGIALDKVGRPDDAARSWQEAIRLDPEKKDAVTRSFLGTYLIRKGTGAPAAEKKRLYEQAVTLFSDAVAVNNKDAHSYNNLGFALEYLGRRPEAIRAYQGAIQADPRMKVAYNNLGVIHEQDGRTADAVRNYEQALQIDPNYREAQDNLKRLRPNR